jgi:hypothetical protein
MTTRLAGSDITLGRAAGIEALSAQIKLLDLPPPIGPKADELLIAVHAAGLGFGTGAAFPVPA